MPKPATTDANGLYIANFQWQGKHVQATLWKADHGWSCNELDGNEWPENSCHTTPLVAIQNFLRQTGNDPAGAGTINLEYRGDS